MTSVREWLRNRPVSEAFETEGARRRCCATVCDFRIDNIFPEDCKSGSGAHTAATILILRPPRTGPKTALRLAIPRKAYSRGILVCALPRAIFGARRLSASNSRDLTISFRDWQPQYAAEIRPRAAPRTARLFAIKLAAVREQLGSSRSRKTRFWPSK
jgi:hypothetical protein